MDFPKWVESKQIIYNHLKFYNWIYCWKNVKINIGYSVNKWHLFEGMGVIQTWINQDHSTFWNVYIYVTHSQPPL
jgi:hypothetical protein